MTRPRHRVRALLVSALLAAALSSGLLFLVTSSPTVESTGEEGVAARSPSRDAPIATHGGPIPEGSDTRARLARWSRSFLPRPRPRSSAGAAPRADTSPSGPPLVRIRVRSENGGAPLAKSLVTISLRNAERTLQMAGETDTGGWLDVRAVPGGLYAAVLHHEQFRPGSVALEVPHAPVSPPPEVDVVLAPGHSLSGEVVDGEGEPVPGARVLLTLLSGDGPQRSGRVTDDDGSFRIDGLPPGRWSLAARHASYRPSNPREVEIPPEVAVRIVLAPSRSLLVSVLDPDGAPLPGATVRAFVEGVVPSAAVAPPTRSGPDGSVALDDLPPDPSTAVLLRATHDEFPPTSRVVTVGEIEARLVEIVFPRAADLRGHVVDATGARVPDAQVILRSGENQRVVRQSTSEGMFHFPMLSAGKYVLAAATVGRGVSPEVELELGPGDEVLRDLQLESGEGAIRGIVVDSTAEPLSLVELRLEVGGRILTTSSAMDGTFAFERIPSGQYRVEARSRRTKAFAAVIADTRAESLVLELHAPGSVHGLAILPGPAAGFSVRLTPHASARREDATGGVSPRVYRFTGQSGFFRLNTVPAGTYTLEVLRGDAVHLRHDPVEVRPGEDVGPLLLGTDG